ncbi:MAG: hypothetical protein JXB23_18920 [Candidatus Aminicenantes bacterium]|nr:hypothetical protein [Candidatus Aminicenantes bacterium]
MKRYGFLLLIFVFAAVLVLVLQKSGLWKTMTAEDLEASIEVVDVKTSWVDKYYQPWPQRLILVPSISFRVKNITEKPIKYINFNANFRFRDDYENLGDAYLAAIRGEPVPPGEKSDVIHLKSNYGVEGKTLASFKDNPQWKIVIVKLFAQGQGSQFLPLGEWEVSKQIDFKEPEPVGMKKQETKEELKNEEKK